MDLRSVVSTEVSVEYRTRFPLPFEVPSQTDHVLPSSPGETGSADFRLPTIPHESRFAKLLHRPRKPTSALGGHCRGVPLVSVLSPGRETEPETAGPKGSARSPKGQRESPTGFPPKGAAPASQEATGSGLRAGTGRKDNSADGFGRTVRANGRKAARTDGISSPGPRPPEREHPEGAKASLGFLACDSRPVSSSP